jgi:hypothetical protein
MEAQTGMHWSCWTNKKYWAVKTGQRTAEEKELLKEIEYWRKEVSYWKNWRLLNMVVGDGHRGPLKNREKTHFLSQITKHKWPHNHKTRPRWSRPNGRGPRTWRPQWPTRTVSPSPHRAKLHFARGIQHRTNETSPRSRAGHPLGRDSASLEALMGSPLPHMLPRPEHLMFRHMQAPKSKMNPRHAVLLTPPGNHIPALFRQPSRWGHPHHCTALCGKAASVSSVTLCYPLLCGPRAAPSKDDGETLKEGTDACLAPAQVNAVTSDQWGASPPSPSALCGRPRYHDAIPGTAAPSPTLREYRTTRHRHTCYCAPYDLSSTAPPSQCTDDDQGRSSHTATLEAAPGRIQGTPRRSAGSKIRQDGRQLYNTAHHAATRN